MLFKDYSVKTQKSKKSLYHFLLKTARNKYPPGHLRRIELSLFFTHQLKATFT